MRSRFKLKDKQAGQWPEQSSENALRPPRKCRLPSIPPLSRAALRRPSLCSVQTLLVTKNSSDLCTSGILVFFVCFFSFSFHPPVPHWPAMARNKEELVYKKTWVCVLKTVCEAKGAQLWSSLAWELRHMRPGSRRSLKGFHTFYHCFVFKSPCVCVCVCV